MAVIVVRLTLAVKVMCGSRSSTCSSNINISKTNISSKRSTSENSSKSNQILLLASVAVMLMSLTEQ